MTRPVLDGTRRGPDPASVPESRRHRLIWSAVAGVHLAAVAAVWMGGALGVSEAAREGGLVLVTLVTEPVALPGEAKGGVALGAGLPVPVALNVAVAVPSAAPLVASRPSRRCRLPSPRSPSRPREKSSPPRRLPSPKCSCRRLFFSVTSQPIPSARDAPALKASSACASRSLRMVPCGRLS